MSSIESFETSPNPGYRSFSSTSRATICLSLSCLIVFFLCVSSPSEWVWIILSDDSKFPRETHDSSRCSWRRLERNWIIYQADLSWWFIVHINYDGPHCTGVDTQRRTPRWKGEKRGRNKQRRDGRTRGGERERRGELSARKGGQTKLFPLGITLCRWIWDSGRKTLIHGQTAIRKAKFFIRLLPWYLHRSVTYPLPTFICPLMCTVFASINIRLARSEVWMRETSEN